MADEIRGRHWTLRIARAPSACPSPATAKHAMLRPKTESSEAGEDAHPPIQQLLLDVRLPLHDLQLLLQPRSLLCHALKVCRPALLLVQPATAVVTYISTLVASCA